MKPKYPAESGQHQLSIILEKPKNIWPFFGPSAKKVQRPRNLKKIPQRNRGVIASGRSAAWLAHLHGVQGVARSNRVAPTSLILKYTVKIA